MSAPVVFMFAGQGSQYFQMGRPLLESHPVFRHWMTRLDDLAWDLCGQRVLGAMLAGDRAAPFDRTRLTHPAIFMVEFALAQCLIDARIEPDLVLGTSLGSFAAAAVGGHLDVEHALAAVLEQAAAFEDCCEPGGMIAVLDDPALHQQPFLREHAELAGIHFDRHFAVAAPAARLPLIESALKARSVIHQRLPVSCAFHSRWVDAARARFEAWMRDVPRRRGAVPLVCCERAAVLDELPADFCWSVVRRPIRFADTLRHLERLGPHRYVDAGPSGTLATFVKYGLPAGSASTAHAVLTPHGRDVRNLQALVAACLPA